MPELYKKTFGEGQALVLLHGWGFNSSIFENMDLHKFKTTLIDLPGHGQSPVIEGDINTWVNEIIKLIPKNAILCGWSLGGLLAIKIAEKIKLKQLILLATTPCFINSETWQYGIDKTIFEDFYQNLQQDFNKTLKTFTLLQTNNRTTAKNLYQQIKLYKVHPKALKTGLDILLNNNLSENLQNLDCDIKVVLGEKDQLVPIKIKQWYQQQNIECVTYASGHLPFLTDGFSLPTI
jgi:pimeloyl-[acyl-carrier protein] methyl ester esterase